jgi:N-hydroxyarylamine O-acetyltransferase
MINGKTVVGLHARDRAMSVCLDEYFERIGWTGDRAPTLPTLAGLLRHHMMAIPFENLDVLLRWPVRVDLAGIQAKLVDARRGGYCFEHTTLFAAILEAIGFQIVRHLARIVLRMPADQSPLAHMFLTVTLPQGRFVVDPGFGGPAARTPLPLPGEAGSSHHMVQDGANWILRTARDGTVQDAWSSTLEPVYPIDIEVANHYIATHPSSPFLNLLMLSRFTEHGRVSVINRDVSIIDGDQRAARTLTDRADLRSLLQQQFGFDLPEVEHLIVPAIAEWN